MDFVGAYDLFGVKLRLTTNSVRVREEARMFLGAHEAAGNGAPDYELEFEETAVMPGLGVPGLKQCHGHEHQILENGRQVSFSVAEGLACYEPEKRTCRGYVFPVADQKGPACGSVPLIHLLVVRMMFAEGFLPLHAAAVNHRGQAVVLSGEKGAGKSTLALKLHFLGFPLLGDDLVYLKRDAARLMAGAHGQPVKLKNGEAGFLLEAVAAARRPTEVIGKTLFPVQQLNPAGVNRLYPLAALVFLESSASTGAGPVVQTDRETEVIHHLLGDSPLLNTPAYRERAFDMFCGAGSCRFLLVQRSTNADHTVQQILEALGGF